MLRLIQSILIYLLPICACGQLYNISDLYVFDALALNPAYAGNKEALSISLLNSISWVGFEGSPKTVSFSIHAPLKNEKVGLGFLLINDKIGVSKEINLIGNYSYSLNLDYGKLAFGVGFGLTLLNTNWKTLAAQDPGDELLTNNSSGVVPDLSTGIYFSNKKIYLGLSIPLFLSHEYDPGLDKYTTRNDFAAYNYFCSAGYIIDIASNTKLVPSILGKYHKGNGSLLDINTQMILRNRFWFGFTYRSKNILAGMIQCQVNNQLRIGYSYDFNISKKIQYNYSSHQIMLNYVFNYKAIVTGPRQF
jgi:type IX secretion system PorP/SprF family membrane protein